MSIKSIRAALMKRLSSLSPTMETAKPNTNFTPPAANVPYQRVDLIPAQPDNIVQGAKVFFERGIFQVLLCYPKGVGSKDADARADALQAHFKRGTTLVQGGISVLITATPHIGGEVPDPDRFCIPVTVSWQAQQAT